MKKTMLHRKKSQRGVALVFSLGILGLMVALGLTFATISFSEQDSSRSASARYSAKLLAKSAVNRVIAVMEKTPDIETNKLVSGGDGKHYDFLWRMITRHGDVPGPDKMYKHIGVRVMNGTDSPYWQYVKVKDGSDKDEIIGRFAYIAYKPIGLLDPIAAAQHDEEGTNEDAVLRLGTSPQEINLAALVGVNQGGKSLAAGDFDALGKYNLDHPDETINTPEDFFKRFTTGMHTNLTDSTSGYNVLRDTLSASWFSIPRAAPQKEAFKKNSSDEKFYHRFNLNRTAQEWNDLKFTEITSADEVKEFDLTGLTATTDEERNTIANKTKAIPWLSAANDETKQIAANFLAYFSPIPQNASDFYSKYDLTATSFNDSAYMPNMRTPYINELLLDVKFKFLVEKAPRFDLGDKVNGTSYVEEVTVTVTPEVDVYVELADLYKESMNDLKKIKLKSPLLQNIALQQTGEEGLSYETHDFTNLKDFEFEIVEPFKADNKNNGSVPAAVIYPVYKTTITAAVPAVCKFQVQAQRTFDAGTGTFGPWQFPKGEVVFREILNAGSTGAEFGLQPLKLELHGDFGNDGYLPIDLARMNKEVVPFPAFGEKITDGADFTELKPFGFKVTFDSSDEAFKLTFDEGTDGTDQERRIIARYQAYDPAANLKPEHWYESKIETTMKDSNDVTLVGIVPNNYYNLKSTGKLTLKEVDGEENYKELEITDKNDNKKTFLVDMETEPGEEAAETGYGSVVSTSFIRGKAGDVSNTKPILSPWEIGFIHRGEPFQTLNIKRFSTLTADAGKYENGDANIFDQLKFVQKKDGKVGNENIAHIRGLVNLNDITAEAADKDDFAAADLIQKGNLYAAKTLFKNIKVGLTASDLDIDPETQMNELKEKGTALSDEKVENVVKHIAKLNFLEDSLLSRSQILKKGSDSGDDKNKAYYELGAQLLNPKDETDTTAVSDANKEELIGKFIMLTSSSSGTDQIGDFLMVVGLAQTIQIGLAQAPVKDWLRDGTFTIPNFSSYSPSKSAAERLKLERAMIEAGFGYRFSYNGKPAFQYFKTLPNSSTDYMKPSSSDLTAADRKSKFYPGYDKILATQKVVAWLRKNASGKWYIERLDYVD